MITESKYRDSNVKRAIHVQARNRLALLLAIPVFVGIFTWSVAREGRRQSIGLRHALRVELSLERLMSRLKEAETSQRGYLLTGEARYLRSRIMRPPRRLATSLRRSVPSHSGSSARWSG